MLKSGIKITGLDEVDSIKSGKTLINELNIIDGKIPLADYEKYRVESAHNSNTLTLGKYEPTILVDGTKCFIRTNSSVLIHIIDNITVPIAMIPNKETGIYIFVIFWYSTRCITFNIYNLLAPRLKALLL